MKLRKLHGIALTKGLNLCWVLAIGGWSFVFQIAHFPKGPKFELDWGWNPQMGCCSSKFYGITIFHRLLGFEFTRPGGRPGKDL